MKWDEDKATKKLDKLLLKMLKWDEENHSYYCYVRKDYWQLFSGCKNPWVKKFKRQLRDFLISDYENKNYIKTIEELEYNRFEHLEDAFLGELGTCDFISKRQNIVMIGNPGTGKTHLAAAIADYIVRETECTAVFRSLHSILQAIKSTYGGDAGFTESDVLQLFTSPDLLIIDEVGATKSSEFELATLFAIINTRYENNSPTVVITNLEAAELKSAIGDRCTDRLREGGGRAIAFNWESKRSEL